jgi:DNA-directed RNA polymerase specialized sigma subunit
MNAQIVEEWTDYVTRIARSKGIKTKHLRDDLISVAKETLCRISDQVPEADFPKAFVARWVDGEIMQYIRKEMKCKVIQESWTVGIQQPSVLVLDYGFTDREKEIIRLRMNGEAINNIAILLKVSRPTVCRDIKSIKEKLRKEPPQRYRILENDLSLINERTQDERSSDPKYTHLLWKRGRK